MPRLPTQAINVVDIDGVGESGEYGSRIRGGSHFLGEGKVLSFCWLLVKI